MVSVLHIIASLERGGAETALLRLCASGIGHAVTHTVVTMRPGGVLRERLESAGVNVVSLDLLGWRSLLTAWRRLRRVRRELLPDIVHGWMYHGSIAALVSGQRMSRVVFGIRQSLPTLSREWYGTRLAILVCAAASRFVARVVFNSYVGKDQHCELGFSKRNAACIPNGCSTAVFKPNPSNAMFIRDLCGTPEGAVLIGTVGRIHAIKNHEMFMHVAARLLREGHDVRFCIVGPGTERQREELGRLARELGIDGVITFVPDCEDIQSVYAGLDAFCLTSLAEGFPNVLIEAMASGVPVFSTDVGDASIILSGIAETVPVNDVGGMARMLLEFLATPKEERLRVGELARQRVLDRYSEPREREALLGVYRSVLDRS